tara:strand:+ start:656 stop:1336 length:681 start_codon:yes stop_codon:yes gene_type:complete
MRKLLLALAASVSLSTPTLANDFQSNPLHYPDEYFSSHSMGCLLLQECKDGVVEITSIKTLEDYYGKTYNVSSEFSTLLKLINDVDSKVYLAPQAYFPVGHRGVYHTVSNHFYLNDAFMKKESTLMSVMRHEGWHMAQDCMAGDIKNTYIAVVFDDKKIPQLWKDMAKDTYPKSALPWEQEAMWTGRVEGMTVDALKACKTGAMWEQYDPTPLTKQFLLDKGFIKN